MATPAGRSARLALALWILAGLSCLFPAVAHAQGAWLPVRGEGSVSLTFQSLRFSGHFDTDGSRLPECAPSSAYLGIAEVEYGWTDKVAVRARLPYVASRFTGAHDELCIDELHKLYEDLCRLYPGECRSSTDTGNYYATFQDFGFSLRYSLIEGAIAVAPVIAATIPSHAYHTIGEAAPGQRAPALLLGVNVGALTEPLLPRGYVQLRYAYSFVQPQYGVSLNRSNAEFEAGFSVTPIVQVRGLVAWQQTHGGVTYYESVDRGFAGEPQIFFDHDRLLKNRYLHIGGGATIALTDSIDLDAAVVTFAAGADSHYGVGIAAGLTWRVFSPKAPSPSNPSR